MKKIFVFISIICSFGFTPRISDTKNAKFCGPQVLASNNNVYDDNNLYQVRITQVSTGIVWFFEPALNYGDPDVWLLGGSYSGGLYNFEIVYYSDNPYNNGYVYIDGPYGMVRCQAAIYGTQTIIFNNVLLKCGDYTVGVRSTPC